MANSSYYYNQMTTIAAQKRRYQNQKDELVAYRAKLKEFYSDILVIPLDIDRSSEKFLSGGYVCDGEGPDHGKLAENSKKLTDACNDFKQTLIKIRDEIDRLAGEITAKESAYRTAEAAYRKAKAEEASGG